MTVEDNAPALGGPQADRLHPLHVVRAIADAIAPDASPVLRAMLLQVLYDLSHDPVFLDLAAHHPVFRWFIGPGSLHGYATARDAMLASGAAAAFLSAVIPPLDAANLRQRPPFAPTSWLLARWAPGAVAAFDDLARLDRHKMQRLLLQINSRDLALALRFTSPSTCAAFLAPLSDRMRGVIEVDIAAIASDRHAEGEEAQGRIVRLALAESFATFPARDRPTPPV